MDVHKASGRSSGFVSATVELPEPVSVEDFHIAQLESAYKVSVSVIYNALMRGEISVDQANEKISFFKSSYEELRSAREKQNKVEEE